MSSPAPLPPGAKTIPDFPCYCITAAGSVFSCRVYGSRRRRLGPWWEMKPRAAKGYLSVHLFREVGKPERRFVHQLVLLVFVGPPPEGQVARHLNDIRTDNRLENLAYGSKQENAADAIRNGLHRIGAARPNARLSDDDVRAIRRLRDGGAKLAELAARFGVAKQHISKICRREIWTHI